VSFIRDSRDQLISSIFDSDAFVGQSAASDLKGERLQLVTLLDRRLNPYRSRQKDQS
jgi:hypothetical protein